MLVKPCQAAVAATLRPKNIWLRQVDSWQGRAVGDSVLRQCSTAVPTQVNGNRRTASALRSLQIGIERGMQTPDFKNLPEVDISPPFIVGVAGSS